MAKGVAVSQDAGGWASKVNLRQIARGPVTRRLVADEAARKAVASDIGVDQVDALEGELTVSPWLDGAEIRGRWRGRIEQTCGVTLEPLPSEPQGEFLVRAVPSGSPNAPEPSPEEELVDLEAEDPPDVLDGDEIDLAAYLVEQLALQIDPFPRKPGAVFEPPDEPQPPSPFEVLRNFKAGPRQT